MLLDAIRKAIETSGVTRYQIAKDTGITQAQLCRLMKGKTGLSIESLERVADCLGLRIVLQPKRRQRKAR